MKSRIKSSLKATLLGITSVPGARKPFFRFRGPLDILNYHRVAPAEDFGLDTSPNRGMTVSLPAFEAQIAHIAQAYLPMALDEVPRFVGDGNGAFRVAVTFDDGYRDNLEYALPILKKYGVPATIYVTTRFPEGDASLWWVELWEILSETERVELEWEGSRLGWDTSTDPARRSAFSALRTMFLSQDEPTQRRFLSVLRGTRPPADYGSEFLSWDEIRLLDAEPLITIGAHTHTHPNLRNCSPEELQDELTTSKRLLEHNLGHAVNDMAYPFGGPGETGESVFGAAAHCGYATAVTTQIGRANPQRMHTLPRLVILDEHTPGRLDIKLSGLPQAFGRPL